MSNVSQNILEKIEFKLNNISAKLNHFECLYQNEMNIKETNNLSNVLKLIDKTKNIYNWTHANGSFVNSNHSSNYQDVMAKWSALIDDLYWSIFGVDFIFKSKEENRIKIIYLKFCEIDMRLSTYIPNLC